MTLALPVRALIVGDGDGLPHLQQRAQELGLGDRVRFTGRVPIEEVPLYTSMMDVALSTQTNNRIGQVRTTGKLPEYMAAGCYVLATDVGKLACSCRLRCVCLMKGSRTRPTRPD